MNIDNKLLEKIGVFLQPLLDGQTRIITTMKALEAGLNDVREEMATKDEIRTLEERTKRQIQASREILLGEIEVSRAELKADIYTINANLIKTVQSHEKRLRSLEEKTGTSRVDIH